MTASKILLLIIDGVGDRPCACLGNKTPLQAAFLPNLDRLAAEVSAGLWIRSLRGSVQVPIRPT